MPLMIRKGDTTSHGGTVLEGFANYKVNQVPLAYEGMKTACGATLIASQTRMSHSAPSTGPSEQANPHIPFNPLRKQTEDRVVQFQIRDPHSKELQKGVAYVIELSDGGKVSGFSNAQGLTKPLKVNATVQAKLMVLNNP